MQFPLKLPQNIASRHRICTSIATKIKELGYLGDCGYNQLLYPVEAQTRDLLKWLVEKLPRSEEEGAQEVLGANALMNRRIMQALTLWKLQPRRLPFCSAGIVPRNVFEKKSFSTPMELLHPSSFGTIDLYRAVKDSQKTLSLEHSIFERHALEMYNDTQYALRLERDFDAHQQEGSADAVDYEFGDGGKERETGGSGSGSGFSENSFVLSAIKGALRKAVTPGSGGGSGTGGGAEGSGEGQSESAEAAGAGAGGGVGEGGMAGGTGGLNTGMAGSLEEYNKAIQAKQLDSSLQDLVRTIAGDYEACKIYQVRV